MNNDVGVHEVIERITRQTTIMAKALAFRDWPFGLEPIINNLPLLVAAMTGGVKPS